MNFNHLTSATKPQFGIEFSPPVHLPSVVAFDIASRSSRSEPDHLEDAGFRKFPELSAGFLGGDRHRDSAGRFTGL